MQCKCVDDQAAINETVEALNRLGYLEYAVIRELKERFGVRAIAQALEGAGGLTASQRAFQRTSQTRSMLSARREKILYLEQEEDPDHRQVFRRYLLLERVLVVWCVELSKDGLVKTLQIRSFSTASVEHPGDSCQVTNHANPESQESNRCELMFVLCMRNFFFQSARRHPSHVACASEIQLS